MSKSKIASALVVLLASFSASAANQGQGTVEFNGNVIIAPCGIASESQNQVVQFDSISKSHLANGGISRQKNVDIKLVQCDPKDLNKGVAVTFYAGTGTAKDQPTELLTTGPSNAVVVLNGYGSNVAFGTPTDFIKLVEGDNTLRFSSWVKQATGKAIGEGTFNALANFNMSYE